MTGNVVPTPVSGSGLLYAISGFRGASLLAIKLGQTGDLTGSEAIAWQHTKGTPYVPSPLLSGERLYFYSGNNGTLRVLTPNRDSRITRRSAFLTCSAECMRRQWPRPVAFILPAATAEQS